MTVYPVRAIREDGWWGLIADLGHRTVASQARRLDQADAMIREAIALVLNVGEDDFDVDVRPQLANDPGELVARAVQVAADRDRLARQQEDLTARSRDLARELRDTTDLTVRDVATLLGVSPGWIPRLVSAP